MARAEFPMLFTPLAVGRVELKNRIFSSAHDTVMADDGRVTDRLIAYHRARAAGGVGLIITQVAGIHDSARYTSHVLMATDDDCIPGYRALAEAVHEHGWRSSPRSSTPAARSWSPPTVRCRWPWPPRPSPSNASA